MTISNNGTESTPLLIQGTSTAGNGATAAVGTSAAKPYYFLTTRKNSMEGDTSLVEERLPTGSATHDFASRPVMGSRNNKGHNNDTQPGFFQRLFQGNTLHNNNTNNQNSRSSSHGLPLPVGMKRRTAIDKAAIKVEPKVFFSSERTFLAWLHTSILLAGASIAITSFSDDSGDLLDQLYGIILLPVAIAFLCYAMHQYGNRSKLIRQAAPGPYSDVVGPSVLAVVLIISIIAQFTIKLYTLVNADL